MNFRDRSVIKALLQKMTDGFLVGTEEFKTAIIHFNIGTSIQSTLHGYCGNPDMYAVDAFTPTILEQNPHGQRSTFASLKEANAYSNEVRATGDSLAPSTHHMLHHQKE